jgi:hypothetical protein
LGDTDSTGTLGSVDGSFSAGPALRRSMWRLKLSGSDSNARRPFKLSNIEATFGG